MVAAGTGYSNPPLLVPQIQRRRRGVPPRPPLPLGALSLFVCAASALAVVVGITRHRWAARKRSDLDALLLRVRSPASFSAPWQRNDPAYACPPPLLCLEVAMDHAMVFVLLGCR